MLARFQEFRCWAPGLNVIVYQGDKENRAVIREYEFHSGSERPLFEVLLTSYELAAFDNSLLSRVHWASLIGKLLANFSLCACDGYYHLYLYKGFSFALT